MAYIPHTDEDRAEMLATIGVESLDDLFTDIPTDMRLDEPLHIPPAHDEHALVGHLSHLAEKNRSDLCCFLGAGVYDHFIPATVGTVLSRGEFLTSYTPYQPELSQGYLQAIYEFQSMVCELTGMDMANASMYDGGTALAEAALLAHGANGRDVVVVSEGVHPHYRQIVKTFCWSAGLQYREVALADGVTTSADNLEGVACLLFQQPNFLGVLEDVGALTTGVQAAGGLSVCCADPFALGVLRPPGEFGVDIVVSEAQALGSPMGFGGPGLGLFAVREALVRRLPGRVVGMTQDVEGRRGFVMTLRTREQDIRREKATSNICTNQALVALAATVYLSALGKTGFRRVAEACVQNAHYAAERLSTIPGVQLRFPTRRFAYEFVLKLPRPADAVRDELLEAGYLAGLPLGQHYQDMEDCLLTCVTEVRTKEEIDGFVEAVRKAVRP
ncbi:MAG: aminomethyl-transferring glycine dehydrogenase subunit GcvPA [Fimbriimonadia bacterium]|jgi:glycine dehydrogenase subunit 1